MSQQIIAYKGFDKDLKCRGFQYEVGKTFEHDGPVEMCGSGFHACKNPNDVIAFYPIENGNRFAVVEMDGEIKDDDSKTVASKLNIKAELSLCDFIKVSVDWHISGWFKDLISKKEASTGNYAHNASTGNYAHNASTGDDAHNASTGNYARNASTGDGSRDQTMGDNGVSASLGRFSKVKGANGTPIALVHYDDDGKPLKFVTGVIGKRGLKADTWYTLTDGKITEVETQS
ncbi:hypothetical protein [uncultured Thalassospira sp.]|uniref:DUF7666 domain-containing protein n=1 Tax=uncultured Thalassospira sp. TaxID=404382 RepID=UPI0025917B30|nr:hypothetical protein [uncultured Thalassospira sp.]